MPWKEFLEWVLGLLSDCVCIWCVYSDFYDKKITPLKNRYKAISPLFTELKNVSDRLNDGKDDDIWKV